MSEFKSIIYNCRKATFLIDKRVEGKINFREQIELRIHLAGCDVCKLYVKQSAKISDMIKQLLNTPSAADVRLDDHFKEQLQVQINDNLNKN